MSSLGIKVSQKGYDVNTCADRFLVFNSEFQTLKIYKTYTVSTTIPASGTNTITINHALGYIAPFIAIYNGSTTSGTGSSFFMNDASTPWLGARQYINKLEIDVSNTFDEDNSNIGDTVYFTIYIFLDDFRTVAEKNIDITGTTGGSGSDYGFKASKPDVSIRDGADSDMVLSSSFFNNIVHKKGTATSASSGNPTRVTHNLGYVPNFLAYIKYDGNTYMEYDGRFMTSSSTRITLNPLETGTTNTYYYIIFKDKVE